jgi:dTDP-4-amino-4,6-dideoxygalactose transaminase
MHVFGHPSDIEELMLISNKFNLVLVEDAAESMGSYYKGQHTGTFGLLSAISFNGNKIITTGGGGAILTSDEYLARAAKHLTTTAKIPHAWEFRHDEVGYNYRMPNLNAALGCAQLEQLPESLLEKRNLYKKYKDAFSNVSGVRIFEEPNHSQSNYWLQTLLLDKDKSSYRNSILESTNEIGIKTRPIWEILTNLEPYKRFPSMDLVNAISLSSRIVNLPSSPRLAIEIP